ncbi:MAG: hypothetical protein RL566_697 [Actinomycetota bacterium]|jgi:glyoxylase-like metal-dependent hydrolase (beta-lactamase superfamily II)
MLKLSEIQFPLGERNSSIWALHDGRETLLFDSGCSGDSEEFIEPLLRRLGISPDSVNCVIASHPDVDHFGGAGYWQKRNGAKVIAHSLDAPLMEKHETFLSERGDEFSKEYGLSEIPQTLEWLRTNGADVKVDTKLDGDFEYFLGDDKIQILHIPGHSRGHLGLFEPETKTLLISDAVLGSSVPYADGSPSFPPTYRFVDSYVKTIQRIKTLDFETLATAHYGKFDRESAGVFLQESLEFTYSLEQAVLSVLSSSPCKLSEIVRLVDTRFGAWPKPTAATALAQPVFGHLEVLEARGVIKKEKKDVYVWVRV